MGADPSKEDGDGERSGPTRPADAWTDAARARADRLHQRKPAAPPPRERKAWFQQLPAKLAAGVVFLVALTTLLGNLLELREKGRDVLPGQPAPAAPAGVAPPVPKPDPVADAPARMRVSLDRIAAQHDGSPGTTDWRFTVEADGQPLLAFGQDDLDDTGGRNVVRPKDVAASLRMAHGQRVTLAVKGWRLSRFRIQGAAPDAVGEGQLSADGGEAAIRVAASEPEGGTFVLYFSADAPAR